MDTVTQKNPTIPAALTGSHLLGKALKHHGHRSDFLPDGRADASIDAHRHGGRHPVL